MAVGKWKLYNSAKQKIGAGVIDLDTHSFKMALFTSSSNANTLTNSVLADLTNQLANGNGYVTNGVLLTGVSWTDTAGVSKFDCNDVDFVANGGPLTFRFAVIFDDTNANKDLLCVCLLDTTPANIVVNDGMTLTIGIPPEGIFTISGGNVDVD